MLPFHSSPFLSLSSSAHSPRNSTECVILIDHIACEIANLSLSNAQSLLFQCRHFVWQIGAEHSQYISMLYENVQGIDSTSSYLQMLCESCLDVRLRSCEDIQHATNSIVALTTRYCVWNIELSSVSPNIGQGICRFYFAATKFLFSLLLNRVLICCTILRYLARRL